MSKHKDEMTDIQNLQKEFESMHEHLIRLDKKMTSVMDARAVFDTQRRQYHILARKVSKLEEFQKELSHAVHNIRTIIDQQDTTDVAKVKKDFDKIIRFDDMEKLQKDVEYLLGVVDGAPGEGHLNSVLNGLDNRLEKVEKELNPAIADAGGKIAKWMNRLEKVEKLMEAALAGIRELELEDKSIQEELTELQDIVRQLSFKTIKEENVSSIPWDAKRTGRLAWNPDKKSTVTCIGAYLDNRYKSAGFVAREDFYKKYTFLCGMLNALPLDEDQLMATPIEDWPTKYD